MNRDSHEPEPEQRVQAESPRRNFTEPASPCQILTCRARAASPESEPWAAGPSFGLPSLLKTGEEEEKSIESERKSLTLVRKNKKWVRKEGSEAKKYFGFKTYDEQKVWCNLRTLQRWFTPAWEPAAQPYLPNVVGPQKLRESWILPSRGGAPSEVYQLAALKPHLKM